jgi:hypothetical protein
VVRCEGLERPAPTVCAGRSTSALDPASDKLNIDLVNGHGLKDPFSWAPPALAVCCCSVGLLHGASGGGRWGGGEGGAPGQARLSRGASSGELCWDFAGGRLGMPLAHPPAAGRLSV